MLVGIVDSFPCCYEFGFERGEEGERVVVACSEKDCVDVFFHSAVGKTHGSSAVGGW